MVQNDFLNKVKELKAFEKRISGCKLRELSTMELVEYVELLTRVGYYINAHRVIDILKTRIDIDKRVLSKSYYYSHDVDTATSILEDIMENASDKALLGKYYYKLGMTNDAYDVLMMALKEKDELDEETISKTLKRLSDIEPYRKKNIHTPRMFNPHFGSNLKSGTVFIVSSRYKGQCQFNGSRTLHIVWKDLGDKVLAFPLTTSFKGDAYYILNLKYQELYNSLTTTPFLVTIPKDRIDETLCQVDKQDCDLLFNDTYMRIISQRIRIPVLSPISDFMEEEKDKMNIAIYDVVACNNGVFYIKASDNKYIYLGYDFNGDFILTDFSLTSKEIYPTSIVEISNDTKERLMNELKSRREKIKRESD